MFKTEIYKYAYIFVYIHTHICTYIHIYIHIYTYIYTHMYFFLLSHFSHVWLCETPEMAAHQAPPSLKFSRQEYWSGLPFPSPMHESESESEVAQSCLTLSNPMDCSPPGSSIHGIFQARVLEWGAIAFSDIYVCIYVCVYIYIYIQICIYVCIEQILDR